MAVGHYTEPSGAVRSLIQRWSGGSTWSGETISEPTGSNKRLYGVTCYTVSDCVAVGEYTNSSRQVQPLVLRWDGSGFWSTDNVLNPTGSNWRLFGVSCRAGIDFCAAVGSYTNGLGVVQPLVHTWDGLGSWSSENTFGPTGSGFNLLGVDCPEDEFCAAAGDFRDTAGQVQPLIYTWDGLGSWDDEDAFGPTGTEKRATGVSCSTEEECVAVGSYRESGGIVRSEAWGWDDSINWSEEPTPNITLARETRLLGVSCPDFLAPTVCIAVGTYTDSTGAARTFAARRS